MMIYQDPLSLGRHQIRIAFCYRFFTVPIAILWIELSIDLHAGAINHCKSNVLHPTIANSIFIIANIVNSTFNSLFHC